MKYLIKFLFLIGLFGNALDSIASNTLPEEIVSSETIHQIEAGIGLSSPSYAVLKKKLDGSYVFFSGDIHFKFIQEYQVDKKATTTVKIYKYNKSVAILNNGLPLEYGVNFYTLSASNLTNGELYTLEMEGNKKQKYYLQFKCVKALVKKKK